jgi:hypothetical protein
LLSADAQQRAARGLEHLPDRGTTVVLEPGREFKVLARNKLEPFRSSLVFEGKRVYIRTEKSLYCIGE